MPICRLLSLVLLLFAAVTLGAQPAPVVFDSISYRGDTPDAPTAIGAGDYRNPILPGFYPDPSICQVGADYYLINSTFAYYPGIPVFHSRDLAHWEQLGHVIQRPDQLRYAGLGVSRGIFAPAISHYDGTFYVVCTMVDGGGNFVVTAKNPAGPWSDPTYLHFEGIDPSLFFDYDGRAWMVNNGAPEGTPLYSGHRAIWLQEFDITTKQMVGPRKVLVNGGVDITTKPSWIEGPHLFKRDGWYYLTCAEGGTGPGHSQVVFRSRTVGGPYASWSRNPILTQRDLDPRAPGAVTCTGHADLVIGPDSKWWAVFLGVRPYGGRFSPLGRETFLLPAQWTDDGWPIILPPKTRVPLVAPAAAAAPARDASAVWLEDFTHTPLSLRWFGLRTPTHDWWRLDPAAGKLLIEPQAERLTGSGNPSYLAYRLEHRRFTVSTVMAPPATPGTSADLALFQNEKYHYFLGVHRSEEGITVFLERVQGGASTIVATLPLPGTDRLELRATGDDDRCTFAVRIGDQAWQNLGADYDATLLTSDVAGGFVGATFGLYARIDP